MHSDSKDRFHGLIPAITSAIVALAGCAALLLMNDGQADISQGGGMITAAAISRAGATAFPTATPDRLR
jgi:ABC-type uncharacterized transport system permease subunit